ncbi:hypothetical protein Bccel_1173 [Pseudobacteroides cellulosolvens ATCC 35603 = DSM 2933]|uniref:Uncharacterized protein n=1 Tax=Pseudobacteroides cellulosolvens ATCC 35603 = DSM 2933 TaxID=398512 RepID=A0A0L6JJN8_9FIRM|nr:hypothetical protein Bccel_1173 [Pseudobacteroides cellulosolvens ATCC 35603 = DSM 2933]
MGKELCQMPLEELWELFPINLLWRYSNVKSNM